VFRSGVTVSELAALAADQGLEVLLTTASAVAHGRPICLVDPEGGLLAGLPVPAGGLRLPVHLHDVVVGHVVYDPAVPQDVATLVGTSLELAIRGARHHASLERAAHELDIGREIQRSLLPHRFPEVAGWRFAADYEPAREVGGDLYDVFRIRGERDDVALLIADVTGKGVPAALLMADTKALLHAAADNADDPADALGRVNRILAIERRSSLFVTAALAAVDADTGDLRLASAGHEPPLVVRADGRLEAIDARGPILGAFAGAAYEPAACHVEAGEVVVLYTDGITDTRDAAGAFYGEARLRGVLADLTGASAEEVLRAVVEDVRFFRGEADLFDDLTVLVAEREP
jgi:sigma-B regulation protein RsbU (phosphoserine phosphatase)